jgi:2-polyprenyl-3-methyl-5-hydroxy-6-metoxy-1,4-benzoquinol methylase
MATPDLLSVQESQRRYDNERLQGDVIVSGSEWAWGWSGPAGTIRAERRATFLIERTGLRPGVSCLELGCGTGEFTKRLLVSGCQLNAVELSEATAQRCRDAVGNRANIIVGNIETGEGMTGMEFDAIVGVSVLHHVNMPLCFANTLSKLKRGGRFAFSEPNIVNPQVWAERRISFVRRIRHVLQHETAFRATQLRKMFEDAGLVVEVSEPYEFLHPLTPRCLIGAVTAIEPALERCILRATAGSIRIAGHRK